MEGIFAEQWLILIVDMRVIILRFTVIYDLLFVNDEM